MSDVDKNKNAVEIFNKHAYAYQNKFMDVSLYHKSLDEFCHHITKQQANVLELACGPGNITHYLLSKRPDLKILGTDLAPNMIELAKVNNPTAEFVLMDCRGITRIHKTYDAIMCGFCLPYLSKEEAIKLIADASKLLNEDGVIYVSTMEDDYHKSGFKKGSAGDELFMHYHTADYITAALEENGLKIINIYRQDFPTGDDSKTTDLLVLAGK